MTALIQRSMSAGEIAPALYSRVDTTRYQSGLRTLRNMYVMRHGGATSRPGTEFVCEVLSRNSGIQPARLIPFVFNDTQTYVLELGTYHPIFINPYLRVHKSGATVLNTAKNITAITKASPAVVTSNGHGYSNGDEVYITSVVGMTQVNGHRFIVNGVTANTFALYDYNGTAIDSSSYTAYSSGGTARKAVKIATNWTTGADYKYLQYDQTADIITVAGPSIYAPAEISRASHTSWSIGTYIAYGPTQAAPTALAGSTGYAATGTRWYWAVTAVSALTGEESLASAYLSSSTAPTTGTPITFTWTAPAGTIAYYNVYVFIGAWAYWGTVSSASFTDYGTGTPDYSNPPPTPNDYAAPKTSTGFLYAGVVASCQQRRFFSGVDDYPGKVWASRPALRKNFAQKAASFADDPIAFTMIGKQVNEVRHILDVGRPLVFTSGGVYSLNGNAAGGLTPTEVNPKQESNHGAAAYPQPLLIDDAAIYVQARGGTIHDLGFDFQQDGYKGNELSLFSAHLFEGKTIVDWAYQETPHRVLWIVLSDGTLASLTYVKEQQIVGWARHDTDGLYKNVCVVPEDGEDRVYFIVERTIGGVAKQYIERMARRYVSDETTSGTSTIHGYVGADCAVVYDGRASSLLLAGTIGTLWTMTLSGGTTWDYTETLTLTASGSYFVAGDVGNAIQLTTAAGVVVTFTIAGYTSGTVVTGNVDITVPAALQSTATTNWAKAITVLTGLDHLEGKSLSVLGDGNVVASANDSAYTAITVTSGAITLPVPCSRITAGLPFYSDLETLDIDTAQGETLVDKSKLVSGVALQLEKTRGVYTGPKPPSDDSVNPKENLFAMKHDTPDSLQTGVKVLPILGQWNSNGRVFIRQIDPLPMTILAVTPRGQFPFRGGG